MKSESSLHSTAAASSTASSSTSSAAAVEPLDSAAALHLLLSPDGYYRYLNIPKPPPRHGPAFLHQQTKQTKSNGDGFDNEESKPLTANSGEVDHDLVKKNYRRLSLRHHPDRPGGDADTFRVLNRAKRVLTNPKLRKQYDLLGLDLDDDVEDHHEEGQGSSSGGSSGGSGSGADAKGKRDKESQSDRSNSSSGGSSSDAVMSHLASATIATIIQITIRTIMLGLVSTIIVRYKLLLLPAIVFLLYIAHRIHQAAKQLGSTVTEVTKFQMIAPLLIAGGLVLMHYGRGESVPWSWTFWLGEATVMTLFVVNSVQPLPAGQTAAVMVGAIAIASIFATLLLRGKFWRYVSVVAFEAVLAFIAVLAFPIMEMILEEIMNEKLRKIGEQVRAHARRMDAYAEKQRKAEATGQEKQ